MSVSKKLILILGIGLILRAALLAIFWSSPLTIVDEQHYHAIAENIINDHQFALNPGKPTAIRPPLYPAFLSAIYYLTGGVHLNAVRIVQILLSAGIIYLTYLLGRMMFNNQTGLLASLTIAVYPTYLFFTHLALSEILFTLLFLLFVFLFIGYFYPNRLTAYNLSTQSNQNTAEALPSSSNSLKSEAAISIRQPPKPSVRFFLAGILLGLGALTRTILSPFLPACILFLVCLGRATFRKKIYWSALLMAGFTLTISPWAVRNSLIYDQLVTIETMGGLNVYMGNYEHTPLTRAWAAVDLTGEKTWYYGHENELTGLNEAQKQKWATEKAKTFILNNKLLTLKRSFIKAANLWGLERTVIGGIIKGQWPKLQSIGSLTTIAFFTFALYSLLVIGSIFGISYNVTSKTYGTLFVLMIIFFSTSIHAVVFGHPRYHFFMTPLLAIFFSWSILNITKIWNNRRTLKFKISALISTLLILVWICEIVFIEGSRFLQQIPM